MAFNTCANIYVFQVLVWMHQWLHFATVDCHWYRRQISSIHWSMIPTWWWVNCFYWPCQLLAYTGQVNCFYWPHQLLLLATSTASTGHINCFYWPLQLLLLVTSTASTGCFYWPRNFLNLSSDTQIISPMYISSFNYVLRFTNSNFKTYTNTIFFKFI